MKNGFAILITSFTLSTAFGATKTVKCVGPVGSKLSSLAGTLTLTPQPNGQQIVTGLIHINGETKIAVRGIYDHVSGTEYATMETSKASKIDSIYINFNDNSNEALSFVEMGGKQLPLNCEGSK